MHFENLDSFLADTTEGSIILNAEAVFCELEARQEKFAKDYRIECLSECGHCCEGYMPVVSETEALVAAYEVLKTGREEEIRAMLSSSEGEGCPLYLKDRAYHCALYLGRSLVCRLFGCSVTEDKDGHLVYRSCKWKKEKEQISANLLEEHRDEVPVMSLYGERLAACTDGSVEEGEPITEALPKALDHLKMIVSYASWQENGILEP